jgi:hypothetical protein
MFGLRLREVGEVEEEEEKFMVRYLRVDVDSKTLVKAIRL